MRRPHLVLAFVALLVVASCATPYGSRGLFGGYSETRLNATTWQVNFNGNGFTGMERARAMNLRRASELAVAYRFAAFVVVDDRAHVDVAQWQDPVHCTTSGNVNGSGYYTGNTSCSGGGTTEIHRPGTSMTVVMLTHEQAIAAPPGTMVYDPRFILQQAAE